MDTTLTKREDIARFIQWHWDEYGFAPSFRDIGAAVGIRSSATVQYHLDAMEHEGLLVKDTNVRSVRLIPGAIPKLCTHDWRVDPENDHYDDDFPYVVMFIVCRWCKRRTEADHHFDPENVDTWLRYMGKP